METVIKVFAQLSPIRIPLDKHFSTFEMIIGLCLKINDICNSFKNEHNVSDILFVWFDYFGLFDEWVRHSTAEQIVGSQFSILDIRMQKM